MPSTTIALVVPVTPVAPLNASRITSAIAIGAKCLWQQIGVANAEAERAAITAEARPDLVLSSDFIVGHPGETAADVWGVGLRLAK